MVVEPRTAVMILVEASLEGPSGALLTVPACMENKSAGGACIRIKTPVGVGSKLRIQGPWVEFSGTAKYCRTFGKEYLVGIQRDKTSNPVPHQPSAGNSPLRKTVSSPLVPPAKVQSPPKRQVEQPDEIKAAERKVERAPIVAVASRSTAMPPLGVSDAMRGAARLQISQPQELNFLQSTELQSKPPLKGKESAKGRTHMGHKWLGLAPWQDKHDDPKECSNGKENGRSEKGNHAPPLARPTEEAFVDPPRKNRAHFQVDLLPTEDIYRAAGIMNPRRGYSVKKVVEMLNSEHIRGLSNEMKRAAVLMALNAAGILTGEVLQDAKARQEALDAYEAEQRKQVEAEWARKEEENTQIEAELERVKAHYMARISHNVEGVAREKTTFNAWVTTKQQESQSMSEAVELCLKPTVSAPVSVPSANVSLETPATRPEVSAAAAGGK